jgi:flagellar motor switch protein FliN/FliY
MNAISEPSLAVDPPLLSIELADAPPGAGHGAPVVQDRLAALRGVKVSVAVVAGHAETTVAELLDLRQGAVLALDRNVEAGFSLVLEDRVIAVGELVAVGDRFGLRITQVAPAPAGW